MKVEILSEKCPAQMDICKPIRLCPNGAIIYKADIGAPLGGTISIDDSKCDSCGICIDLCCGQALVLN